MKKIIIRFLIFLVVSFMSGFLDACLHDFGIDISYVIHFSVGFFTCWLFWRW